MPEVADDYERALQIFRATAKKTHDKSLTWTPRNVTSRRGAYEVDLQSGNLEIGYADNDGAPPHDFHIYGPAPEYELVHRISGREHPDLEAELAELHNLVERQVKGIEDVFENILSELGEAP